ncbi:hypothetical protein AMK06_CH03791 [Rhizobium sp. N541]|nr:hypothetical protein AMK05_CH03904 [Rhizobium sp. N324]ANM18647.1 hypothetical protein AMK06_CH03791 [Rhizobium sp. N541]ANM25033.1 hypothetical protein AMK07_CH03789 [Rhizobium sp. N941]OYD05764.1 hypothetical protein AMK08_CH103834 [Rhizobium sp. N4311]
MGGSQRRLRQSFTGSRLLPIIHHEKRTAQSINKISRVDVILFRDCDLFGNLPSQNDDFRHGALAKPNAFWHRADELGQCCCPILALAAEEAPKALEQAGFHAIVLSSAKPQDGWRAEANGRRGTRRFAFLISRCLRPIFTMQQRCHAPNLSSGCGARRKTARGPAGFDRRKDDDEDAIHGI